MNTLRFNPETLEIEVSGDGFESFIMNKREGGKSSEFPVIDRYRLEASLACDLACKYCVVHMNKVSQRGTLMSMEIAKEIIGRFNKEIGKRGSIVIIGGEPLLNWEVVQYIISACEGKVILFTNAYKLDEEKRDFLREREVHIIASLDGVSYEHNRNRFPSVEVFKQVADNIALAARSGCRIALSCVVNQDNVEDVCEIAEYFSRDLGVGSISFAYPHFAREDVATNDFDMDEYTERIKELLSFSKQNGVYIDQLGGKLKSIIRNRVVPYSCKAGISQRAFYPDGRETICTKLDTIKDYDFDEFLKALPANNARCSGCIAVNLCGGGCPWDAYMSASEKGIDERICRMNQDLVGYIIKDIENEIREARTRGEIEGIIAGKYLPIIDPIWIKQN